jgi:hypothetical protein
MNAGVSDVAARERAGARGARRRRCQQLELHRLAPAEDQHRVAVGEEPVALRDRVAIGGEHRARGREGATPA